MRFLEIDSSTTLAHILNELKTMTEDGLEISIVPGEKTILDNSLNRTIIEKIAAQFKRRVVLPVASMQETPSVESDNLGFVENEDVVSKLPIEEVPKVVAPVANLEPHTSIQSITKLKKKIILPSFFKNKFVIACVALVLVLSLLGFVVAGLPSATVTLTLAGEEKEKEMTLIAETQVTEANLEKAKVSVLVQEVTKKGSDEADATGKKTVGTPAKGRVTIVNQDTNAGKNFLANTTITPAATYSATFKTNEAITLDPAPFGGQSFGDVNVTAVNSGSEGNLPAGVVFKVGSSNLTFVFAKNNLAFSGGSTKQVTVVTAADREALKSKIVDKLTKEVEEELEEKMNSNIVPEGGLETVVSSENYEPNAVDAESAKVEANISVKTTVSLIKKDDLRKILANQLKEEASGFEVDLDGAEISAKIVEKLPGGDLKITARIKAKLVPKMNKEQIRNAVKGKSLGEVESYLNSLENVSGYTVTTTPAPFRLLRWMPFLAGRISINFETE